MNTFIRPGNPEARSEKLSVSPENNTNDRSAGISVYAIYHVINEYIENSSVPGPGSSGRRRGGILFAIKSVESPFS